MAMSTPSIHNCCICRESLAERSALEIHLAAEHVFYSAYECEHCKTALFPTDHALRQHYRVDHRQKNFSIKYRVTPGLEKKRIILDKLLYASLNGITDAVYLQSLLATIPGDKELCNPNESFNPLLSFDEVDCGEDVLALLNATGTMAKSSLGQSTPTYSNGYNQQEQQQEQQQSSQANPTSNTELSQNSMLLLNSTADSSHSHVFNKATGLFTANSLQLQEDLGQTGNEILAKLLGTASSSDLRESTRRQPIKRQFDQSSPVSQPSGQKRVSSQVACVDCGRQVSNYMNSLVLHVSTHHCDQPVYECLACNKQWFSLSARLKEHFRKHNNDLSLLKDNRSILSPILKEKAAKLFPTHRFV